MMIWRLATRNGRIADLVIAMTRGSVSLYLIERAGAFRTRKGTRLCCPPERLNDIL